MKQSAVSRRNSCKHLPRLSGAVNVFIPFLFIASITQAQTLNDGVYTPEQVEQGAAVFDEHCKECHSIEATELIFRTWNQERLSSMYDTMSATMPLNNAGSLDLDDYTHALAYLLDMMGYPAGDQELSPYDGTMRDIKVAPVSE